MAVALFVLALLAAASAAPESRVVGGDHTTIEEFPYVVAHTYYYPNAGITIQRCVGSLLSSWHVLTSGFCFTGAVISNMNIRAGSTNSLSGGTLVQIADVVKHPDYVETPRANDLAVVFLSFALGITDTINVLFLPPQGTYIADYQSVKIVSWGFESLQGPQLETLKTVFLDKLPLDECVEKYADTDVVLIADPVICAKAAGRGMCIGDSGAPMVIDNVLVGASSYYQSCDDDGYPNVFSRVDRYTNWILEVASAGRSGAGLRSAPLVK